MEPINPRPPPPEEPNLERLRAERSSLARRRAQQATPRLTANEINEFLAHSDDESSGDVSDWDEIQEESMDTYLSATMATQSQSAPPSPPPPPNSSSTTHRDVGVAELFGSVRSNQDLNSQPSSSATGNTKDDILSYSDANRTEYNEYGTQIFTSLASASASRHDRKIHREVEETLAATATAEEEANSKLNKPLDNCLSDAQKKALHLREEKRKKTLAALNGAHDTQLKQTGDYFVATPTNIRVMRPQLSSELWITRTSTRKVFTLPQFLREAGENTRSSDLQSDQSVVVGVLGSKTAPRRSKNDKIFSIWRLTDLSGVGTGGSNSNVSLFLFGAVHDKLWKEPEGTVIAILKPKILPPHQNTIEGDGSNSVAVTVDSAPFVMLLGISPDFATCAGTTKAGRQCNRIINKSHGRHCDFHVKSAYYKASSSRPGFSTSVFPRVGGSGGFQRSGGGGFGSTPFTLPRAADMPVRDAPPLSTSSARVTLNMMKLASAGYTMGPTSNFLNKPIVTQKPMTEVLIRASEQIVCVPMQYDLEKKSDESNSATSALASGTGQTEVPSHTQIAPRRGIASQNRCLSKSEAALASNLVRPSMGSLNLLRHLEKCEKKDKVQPKTVVKPKIAFSNQSSQHTTPIQPLASKSDETFSNFFEGAKKAHQVSPQPLIKPTLGRRFSLGNGFIDLGPKVASRADSCSTASRLTTTASLNAVRRRTEALVRNQGGVKALNHRAHDMNQKRIADIVARSAKKAKIESPLSQLLDTSSKEVLENINPSKEDTQAKKDKAAATLVELVRLVGQGSRHGDLVEAEEVLSDRKLLNRLGQRDELEERLLGQFEQECQIVTCKTCNYRSMRADRQCRKEGHILEFSTGMRRFFKCRNCKTRTTTLERYPKLACNNCGDSLFEKTGSIAERNGPKIGSEKLCTRGFEEKYLS